MVGQKWEHLQTFLRAAATGSFTKAAKELGISQPTVSRAMEELEQVVGGPLFIRHSRGLRLTDRGASMVEALRGLDHQVQEVYRKVARNTTEPEGVVRLSINEPLAIFALPGALRRLRQNYPKVALEVVVENTTSDLTRREADIAVRMFEPRQGELLAQFLGEIHLGFFASRKYLENAPQGSVMEVSGHTLIGMDLDAGFERLIREIKLPRDFFPVRTDNLLLTIAAAEHGVGIIGTHLQIGRQLGLEQLPGAIELPSYPVWLVRHEALRNDLAVRVVAEELKQTLTTYIESDSAGACL